MLLLQTEALQAAYQAFDTGRGLSAREVKYALRGLGHTVSKADAEAVLARHARSNGEALTEAEFVSAVQRLEQSRDPAAEQAKLFGLLDTEASGFVAVSDLQQVRAHHVLYMLVCLDTSCSMCKQLTSCDMDARAPTTTRVSSSHRCMTCTGADDVCRRWLRSWALQ